MMSHLALTWTGQDSCGELLEQTLHHAITSGNVNSCLQINLNLIDSFSYSIDKRPTVDMTVYTCFNLRYERSRSLLCHILTIVAAAFAWYRWCVVVIAVGSWYCVGVIIFGRWRAECLFLRNYNKNENSWHFGLHIQHTNEHKSLCVNAVSASSCMRTYSKNVNNGSRNQCTHHTHSNRLVNLAAVSASSSTWMRVRECVRCAVDSFSCHFARESRIIIIFFCLFLLLLPKIEDELEFELNWGARVAHLFYIHIYFVLCVWYRKISQIVCIVFTSYVIHLL